MPSSAVSGASAVAAEHDDRHRAEARAGRHADKAGIGQRIAEQPLHDRAGDGERCADQHAEDDARQADVVDDDAVARRQRIGRRSDGNSQSRTTAKAEASDAPEARLNSTVAASTNGKQRRIAQPGAARERSPSSALSACSGRCRPAVGRSSRPCPLSVLDLRRRRARRRGRGWRPPCAGRSRADRRRPCGRACFACPAGVGAIAGCANSSAFGRMRGRRRGPSSG